MNWKKSLLFISSVAVLLAGLFFFSNALLTNYTNDLLRKKLRENSNQLYQVSYEEMELNIFDGEIRLTNIQMEVDTAFADSLKKHGHFPKILYSGAVNEIMLDGINALDIYWNKVIRVNTLYIHRPEVSLLITHSNDSMQSLTAVTGDGIKELLEYLNHSRINSVSLEEGLLQIHSEKKGESRSIGHADNFRLHITNFEIDSSQAEQPYLVEEVAIAFEHAEFDLSSEYYMKLSSLALSLKDSNFTAQNLKLIPKEKKQTFTSKYATVQNRIEGAVEEIHGHSVNFNKLIFKEMLDIKRLEIKGSNMNIYRDRTKPWPNKRYPTPFEMIQHIPIATYIKEVKVMNASVENEQLLAANEKPASLSISNMYLSFYNLTNDSAKLAKNNTMEVALQMNVMSATTLRGNANFNLTNPSQLFDFTIKVSKTSLLPFNPLIKQFMHLELASGELHEGTFSMQGNKRKIIGNAVLDYSNATIKLGNNAGGFLNKLKNNLLSGLANTVIRNDNRIGHPIFKEGKIDYRYNSKLPFIRNVWLATQLGMLDSMIPFGGEI